MEIINNPQKITFKEAEAILDLAARLSVEKGKFGEISLEELFSIAQEANIPSESVRQALNNYSERQSPTVFKVSQNNESHKHSILPLIQGCFSLIVALIAFKEVFPYTRNLGTDLLTEFLKPFDIAPNFFFASPFKLLGVMAISSVYLITIIIFSNFLLLTSYIATKISFFIFKFIYSKVLLKGNSTKL